MTYTRYIPDGPLNAYIEDLYYMDGRAPYPRQKVLPVASLNMMVNLGPPFQVYEPDQTEPFITCHESWWVGLWRTYHVVDWPLNVQFFGIHFKPGGAYPFLQIPLAELSSQVVALDAIWGHYAAEIRERLHAVPTVQAGFNLLERILLARLNQAPHGLDVVQYAIAEIAQHHGTLSIRALSDHIGISQNHLGTQFKKLVGAPAKETARLYRFANVLRLIDSKKAVDLTRITYKSGFYDQSHFNRDFLALTGHNPSEYVRLRRLVQSENPEDAQNYYNLPID